MNVPHETVSSKPVTAHAVDRLIFGPADVDLARSPLALAEPTRVLGAFNPGLTRLPSGNLLLMVRVAETLREPVRDDHVRAIRWADRGFVLDRWPLEAVDLSDPRVFRIRDEPWTVLALTSLSWLLPVELTPDGLGVLAVHYDKAIVPHADFQCYGLEDPRISLVDGRWLMTVCSVSPERQGTSLYESDNALDWRFVDLVLDHQNKDMLIFEGRIGGRYWAQTRPLGDAFFAYPPTSRWRAGPSINLAVSPDAVHWKPHAVPGIRPEAATRAIVRMGGGAPPVQTPRGWLSLWHGVEPGGDVGIYRTYWTLLDADDPATASASGDTALIEPAPGLLTGLDPYLSNVTFTTGIVDAGSHFVVASGEADIACRITHVAKDRVGL